MKINFRGQQRRFDPPTPPDRRYFQNLEQFCRRFGFEIVDGFAELNKAQEKPRREGGEEQRKAAAFVCFSSTASSITHTLMLYNVGIQKHVEGVVSLVDKVAGRDQLEAENRGGELAGLEVVCSSIIHDELFKSVRIWSRMGDHALEAVDWRRAVFDGAQFTASCRVVAPQWRWRCAAGNVAMVGCDIITSAALFQWQ